jgi:O-antigen ligase
MAVLIVVCFVSVLLLSSQSRASYPTYLLALLMLLTIPKWLDVFKVDLVRWVVAILLWLCISALWSEPFVWRETVSVWSRGLLVFFFVVAFAECQVRGQLQSWMAGALTVVGGVAVIAALVNYELTDPWDGRLNGLGQLDTHVVAALVYGVILIFALHVLFGDRSSSWKALAVVTIVAAGLAIALSDSRNAWVSVALGAGTFVLTRRIPDPKQLLLTLATLAIVLGVAVLALTVDETTRAFVLPRGDSYRPAIWTNALQQVLFHGPFFGLGIGTPDNYVYNGIDFPHPHSMYLSLLFQGGLVALAIYLVMIVKTVLILIRNYHREDARLSFAVLVLALSSHLLDGHELIDKVGDTWFLIWFPVGVAVGLTWRPQTRAVRDG